MTRSQLLNYLRELERYPNLIRSNKMAAKRRHTISSEDMTYWSYMMIWS